MPPAKYIVKARNKEQGTMNKDTQIQIGDIVQDATSMWGCGTVSVVETADDGRTWVLCKDWSLNVFDWDTLSEDSQATKWRLAGDLSVVGQFVSEHHDMTADATDCANCSTGRSVKFFSDTIEIHGKLLVVTGQCVACASVHKATFVFDSQRLTNSDAVRDHFERWEEK